MNDGQDDFECLLADRLTEAIRARSRIDRERPSGSDLLRRRGRRRRWRVLAIVGSVGCAVAGSFMTDRSTRDGERLVIRKAAESDGSAIPPTAPPVAVAGTADDWVVSLERTSDDPVQRLVLIDPTAGRRRVLAWVRPADVRRVPLAHLTPGLQRRIADEWMSAGNPVTRID